MPQIIQGENIPPIEAKTYTIQSRDLKYYKFFSCDNDPISMGGINFPFLKIFLTILVFNRHRSISVISISMIYGVYVFNRGYSQKRSSEIHNLMGYIIGLSQLGNIVLFTIPHLLLEIEILG